MNTSPEISTDADPASSTSRKMKQTISAAENFLLRIAPGALRWALGVTLLSAVADRFGGWGTFGHANVSWGDWTRFVAYTAKVNGFLPAAMAPALAVAATIAEIVLGAALLIGVYPRTVAWATTGLFAAFAGAMSLSFGVKAPLNYSVFADAAAALLLAAGMAAPTKTHSPTDQSK